MSATQSNPISKLSLAIFVVIALMALVLAGQAQAGKNKGGGGDDIILYNGNIVLRGSGGGGKGKGGSGGSIVVANSPQGMDVMPMFGGFGDGGFGRKRR